MRVVIDTNVLISATTDRDSDQEARIRGLIRAAATGEVELLVPQCSLFEFVYALSSVYALADQRIHRHDVSWSGGFNATAAILQHCNRGLTIAEGWTRNIRYPPAGRDAGGAARWKPAFRDPALCPRWRRC